MNKLKKEYLFFKQQEPNMRTLLVTNMLYALVLPIVEIFVGAYIMRNTSDPVMVAFYQLAMYIGIITTSLVDGYLLKKYSVKTLYSVGTKALCYKKRTPACRGHGYCGTGGKFSRCSD